MVRSLKIRKNAAIWLISYLMVLVVPIIINIITYLQTETILINKVNDYNMQMLSNKRQHIDNVLDRVFNFANELSRDAGLDNIASYSAPLSTLQIYEMSLKSKNLIFSDALQDDIENVFIYFPKSDYIVGMASNNTPENYFKTYYSSNLSDYEKWYSMVKTNVIGKFVFLQGQKSGSLFCLYADTTPQLVEDNPTIVVELKSNFFLEKGEKGKLVNPDMEASRENSSNFFIWDKQEGIVASRTNADAKEIFKGFSWEDLNVSTSKYYKDKKTIISSLASQSTKWVYIFVTDANIYMSEAAYARKLMYAGITLSIILGIGLIIFAIRRNNRPVKELISKLSEYGNENENVFDEYQYIDNVVMNVINEKQEYADKLSAQKRSLRDGVLVKLLKRTDFARKDAREQLASLDIKFEYNYFSVILFYIEDISEIFFETQENPDKEFNRAQFIMKNIIQEMLARHCISYMFECDELTACIVNVRSDDEKTKEIIKEIITEAREFIFKNFNFKFVAAISGNTYDLSVISNAYDEAKDIMEYKFFTWQEPVMQHADISNMSKNEYYYPMDQEQKIINCLKIGDYKNSIGILNEILDINFGELHLSLQFARCLMFDIISTLIKAMNEVGLLKEFSSFDNLDVFERITACDTVLKMRAEMDAVLKEMCTYIEANSTKESSRLVERVKAFVNDYYDDINLNVAVISDHLNISPNYLSSVFKQSMGIGLHEYATKVRIDKAKELLKKSEMTIEAIAKSVGYLNTGTFSRAFAKSEGIPPGKYRLMQ